MENYARNKWSKHGLQKLMMKFNGFFFFKFASMQGVEDLLENGPYFIRNIPIILSKWPLNVSLTKEDLSKVPVWIKLHDVPLVAFTGDGFSMIATKLDTPFMLHSYTSTMCIVLGLKQLCSCYD